MKREDLEEIINLADKRQGYVPMLAGGKRFHTHTFKGLDTHILVGPFDSDTTKVQDTYEAHFLFEQMTFY